MNKAHNFTITLQMDGKTIAKRVAPVVEYNDNVVYSLRLNQLMKDMMALVEDALRDNSVKEAHRLLPRDYYTK